MVRILWVNPVGTDAYDAPIGAELREEAAPATRVDVCSLPGVGPQHLEWNALEAVVAGPTMGVVRWASEQQGYDAAVIGYDSVPPRELEWIPAVEPVRDKDPRP